MSNPPAGLFEKMPARVDKMQSDHERQVPEESDSDSEMADVDIIVEKLVADSRDGGDIAADDETINECTAEDPENMTGNSNLSQTCEEDNLHGLSITPQPADTPQLTSDTQTEVGAKHNSIELNLEKLDLRNDRPNPFNGSLRQSPSSSASVLGNDTASNFVPLESFGNDEIAAGSFIPARNVGVNGLSRNTSEVASMKIQKKKQTSDFSNDMSGVRTPTEHSVTNSVGLQTSPSSSMPSANTDPWVKIADDVNECVAAEVIPQAQFSVDTQQESQPAVPENGIVLPTPVSEKLPNDRTPTPETGAPLDSLVIDVPGPCEPEDLIEGIIFSANYLGTTQLMSNRNPAKNARMFQAQEAVNRIKAPDGESQPTVEVDLFISTSKIKILNADTQETMMGHTLRSISYIADVGDLLVIMAKRHSAGDFESEEQSMVGKEQPKRQRIICHVLSSSDSHLIAESIGQCFNVAYQQFLQSNCIEPQTLTQADFNNILDTQEMYHDDLVHYSKQENVKEIWIEKKKGEAMGIAIVESGWGSIIPTVILANLQHGSPMERNGKFSIGDQIMSINNTSLVGLPLQTCHSIIKGLRNQTLVKVNIVSCPPVVSVLIKRPDLKHQLGFSVQNGIICSLMRGGIAERGGVRVGHRIIEISNQSVVATPHDKIVQMLVTSVGEIQMKTMPAAMYRLLTGQEQPIYL